MGKFFDQNDEQIREFYAEEAFIAEVQYDISKLMAEKGLTRAELARRLKVSPAHVTQMLGYESANLTARTIARLYEALGETPHICSKSSLSRERAARNAPSDWLGVATAGQDIWDLNLDPSANSEDLIAECGSVVWLDNYRKVA